MLRDFSPIIVVCALISGALLVAFLELELRTQRSAFSASVQRASYLLLSGLAFSIWVLLGLFFTSLPVMATIMVAGASLLGTIAQAHGLELLLEQVLE